MKGTISDSVTNKALAYVTIALLEKSSRKIVKATLSQQDGTYILSGIAQGSNYELTLSYVGYKQKIIDVPSFNNLTLDLGSVSLVPSATQLQEVQVSVLRPLIEQDIDKTIYNVEDDPDANVLNSLDMLRKVPFLDIDAEDNLLLNGQGDYQILVNGRRSSLFSGNPSEIFKSIPASSIKRIEVITVPSAKYEAVGAGGVINVITSKKSLNGYSGSINFGAGSPETYSGSTFLLATAGKASLSARFNSGLNNNPLNSNKFYRNDRLSNVRLEQTGKSSSENNSQSFGTELNYELSSLDLITLSYSLDKSESSQNFKQQVRQVNDVGEATEAYLNLNEGENNGTGNSFTLEYERNFEKSALRRLSTSLNRTENNSQSYSEFAFQPLLNYRSRESTTYNGDNAREFAFQADYIHPIGKQTLEIGVKSVSQENGSNFFYKNFAPETGDFILDTDLSNSFDYNQNIKAAYASFNLRKNKWGVRTGLRVEETSLKASFYSSGTKAEQLYLNLFPSITISRLLKQNSSLKLSYNKRVTRPVLFFLNPYVDATDPYNISFGNPELAPAVSHHVQVELIKNIKSTFLSASLFYYFTDKAIQPFTTLGEDSVARTTFGNFGRNYRYGFSHNMNTTLFNKLNINISGSPTYIRYSSMLEGRQQRREGLTYTLKGSSSIRFSQGWRSSLNFNYNSANVLLQGRTAGYTWSSVSLSKQFLKNEKASISISVRSPFQKYRRSINEIDGPRFYQLRESYTVLRQYNIAFSYRFGKLK